jgi:dTDP-4-amino-4,6-dideoxygalactose transaminase
MVDMTALNNSLDASQGIEIVEDAAQAVGAKFQGRPAGSFGLGCFSLYATKNVGCGEGGMITTSNSLLAEKMRILRNQGMRARYEYVVPGHNYRLTDLHAAIAIPQMEDIDGIITARSQNAAALTDGLKGLEGLVLPSKREGDVHVWNQFTIRLTTDAPVTRDDVITHLSNEGIGTGIYYPNVVFDYDCYRNHPLVSIAEVPIADTYVKNCLSIPVHPSLDKDDINRIISTIQEMWPK